MKICKIQSPDLLFPVVFILLTFTSADTFQDFRHKFSFLNVFSQPLPPLPPLPHPHLNGQNPLSMKKVFCRCFLTNLFFETQTNLNSSSSNSNSFYILRSHTIADECTLVKDLRVNIFNSVSSSPPSFLSQL